MPRVHRNTLIGNRGVWTVGAWLSDGGCLVRPVAADTDIGIDLYCESTVPSVSGQTQAGFLHFFVQVKSGKTQVHVSPDGQFAQCRLKRKHLTYWAQQPVPVFVFLFPDPPKGQGPRLHVIDVTKRLAEGTLFGQQGDVVSDASYDLHSGEDQPGFLNLALRAAYVLHACLHHGVCQPFPQTAPGYVSQFPGAWGYFARNGYNILRQIRASATQALFDLVNRGDVNLPEDHERRLPRKDLEDLLAGILAACEKHGQLPHWDSQRAVGVWHEKRGRLPQAKKYFLKGAGSIKSDRCFQLACPEWQSYVEDLLERVAACDRQL